MTDTRPRFARKGMAEVDRLLVRVRSGGALTSEEAEKLLLDLRATKANVANLSRDHQHAKDAIGKLQRALEERRAMISRLFDESTHYRRLLGLPLKKGTPEPQGSVDGLNVARDVSGTVAGVSDALAAPESR